VSTTTSADEAATLQDMISALSEHDEGTRVRLLRTVETFFGVSGSAAVQYPDRPDHVSVRQSPDTASRDFSDHPDISPKDFLFEKRPQTDVERVVCLAYYLAHYRDKRHFQTLEVSKLNTEAAQPKFSNPAQAVANSIKCGYLAQASKGLRQLSTAGERFVQALPDREAAKATMKRLRLRRNTKVKATRKKPERTT
jgi:hypothetical protein